MDDPIRSDRRASIQSALVAIAGERRIGNLHDQADVVWPRMPARVVANRAPNDGDVRLRFAVRGRNGVLNANAPAGRQLFSHRVVNELYADAVRRIQIRLGDNPSVQQLDAVVFGQDAELAQAMILLDREPPHGEWGQRQDVECRE